jgi:hypothetical protein
MHVPSQPLDAITAFAVPNPNRSSQSLSVLFAVRLPRLVALPWLITQFIRTGDSFVSPTLSTVDGS